MLGMKFIVCVSLTPLVSLKKNKSQTSTKHYGFHNDSAISGYKS